MRKIEEVLRLRAAGLTTRDIAGSVNVGRTSVQEYLARAAAAGIGWPLPADLDEATLELKLFPPPTAELAASRPLPDWLDVHRELRRRGHITLQLLWLEWRESHPEGWGYSQFCLHYRRWLGLQDVVMRFEYAAGERLFVDFAGDTMTIVDAATGEETIVQIFVSVLGCSGLMYVEATRSQELRHWLDAHVHAFEFYGGVSEVMVPDNLKSGVTRACRYDPEVNPSYLELARHYGTIVLPARARKPRDKAAVEAGVLTAERWVLAPLRNRRFFSLGELNAAIRERLEEVNARKFRGQPTSRRDLFEDLERTAMKPLPSVRYEFAEHKPVTANIDYHVEYDGHCYSVPYRLVRQRMEVRATATTVEVLHRNQRVASHAREYGRRRFITDPEHMPKSHREHLEWTPSRLIEWGTNIAPEVGALIGKILESYPHPEHGYRQCLGLTSLAKKKGADRLAAACARAIALNAISYTSVKSILQQNLDRVPVPAGEQERLPLPEPPAHENLRGAEYFAAAATTARA